jgi:hypothetical protein
MRSFKQYLMESARTYNYTIKIAGELPKDFLEMFKYNLNKFSPTEIGEPTTTPIQKDPYGFPNMKNVPVTIIKAKFKYPTTEPMIQQVVQLLGFNMDINCVRVVQTDYNDSINTEQEQYEKQGADGLLLNTAGMDVDKSAKEANKAYGNQYLDSIKKQSEDDRPVMPYATKKTPTAFDPYTRQEADKSGTKSPMTKVTRPARPKTGSTR